jgi:hypothetical protein
MDNILLLATFENGFSDLKDDLHKVSVEKKAELATLSRNTKQQLALLTQTVSAIHAKLFETTVTAHDSSSTTAVHEIQHRHQRARANTDHIPAKNEVLDTVFSFVGVDHYYYVAGVCRNWRGRYMQLCAQTATNMNKFNTSQRSVTVTAARLQLALDNGLTIDKLAADEPGLADSITQQSLEPIAVLTLARVYGFQWCEELAIAASYCKKYELLQWLIRCGCPWGVVAIAAGAFRTYDVAHMTKIRAITGPWPANLLRVQLCDAALFDKLDTVKWLREQGVAWPERFCNTNTGENWSLKCVQWAIANGSTWLVWRCQDLESHHYECRSDGPVHIDNTCSDIHCYRKHAQELFAWAHKNGCPCTCAHDAAPAAGAAEVAVVM